MTGRERTDDAKGKRVRVFSRTCAVSVLALLSLGATGRDSPLIDAVKASDAATVRALLQQEVDVGGTDIDGTTALHWAVHDDDPDIVDLLLAAGVDAAAANRYGATPISLACENGSAAIIERLLKAGADPNTALADGETALMTAARTGRPDAVTVLLRYGAEVNAKERQRGQTALIWAASENNAAAADALIHAGARIDWRSTGGFTPLLFATRAGHIETTRVLLEAGADVNDTLPDGTSALALAIINAHYELAAVLLDAGADPNADRQGWTALHQVAYTRRPNIGLADPGALPTGTVSGLALVSRLVERGANVNARQTRERQLKNGLDDRNILNRVGATPFLLAAKHADAALMRALVAYGADPLLTNEDGTTPLMAAAGVGIWVVGENAGTNEEALEAVQLALELGGDVNAVDGYGYTALHGAAHRAAPAIVQLLAERGAKLDAQLTKTNPKRGGAKEGWTPLTIAEGVFYANTFKRNFETAALLRELLAKRSQIPRTAWGDPDLQGVWDYFTFTPLERPEEFAEKDTLTDEEAAIVGQQGHAAALARDRDGPAEGSPGSYGQQVWTDRARATALTQPSLLVDPPEGRIPPLTAVETSRLAAVPSSGERPVRTRADGIGADGPEDRGLAERCLVGFSTGPPMLPSGYNNNVQIVQSPTFVALMVEMVHDVRIIPLDGRPALNSNIRQWLGSSRARWDGETLVVETTNFTGKVASFSTTSESWGTGTNLRLIERFTRVDADTLHYEFTVEDPTVFSQPFSGSLPMNRSNLPLYEYACQEGNYGLHNILSGARVAEKTRASAERQH